MRCVEHMHCDALVHVHASAALQTYVSMDWKKLAGQVLNAWARTVWHAITCSQPAHRLGVWGAIRHHHKTSTPGCAQADLIAVHVATGSHRLYIGLLNEELGLAVPVGDSPNMLCCGL